ncbi:MAG: SGNH/GDSL hydrolase family protein, partial [Kiritimatiellia bacterium]
IPTVNVGVELANRTAAGTFSWERYRDCHPSPEGNQMVADLVGELLDRSNWNRPLAPEVQVADHPSPAPLDRLSYARGCFVPFARVTRGAGWEVSRPDWKRIPGSKRDHYCAEPILWSVTPGAECSFTFEGTAVGAWVTAGGDAGCVEVSIDGGAWRMFDLITSYSAALHYPYTKMFATDLAEGPHIVKLRVAENRAAGRGTAVRIHRLAVNGRP